MNYQLFADMDERLNEMRAELQGLERQVKLDDFLEDFIDAPQPGATIVVTVGDLRARDLTTPDEMRWTDDEPDATLVRITVSSDGEIAWFEPANNHTEN